MRRFASLRILQPSRGALGYSLAIHGGLMGGLDGLSVWGKAIPWCFVLELQREWTGMGIFSG